jgi:hypothetical protein
MKLKLLAFIAFLLLFSQNIQARQCETPDVSEAEYQAIPWYGNPDFLTNFYDSLENAFNSSSTNSRVAPTGVETPWYRIPVKFWVYQIDENNRGGIERLPTQRQFQRLMDELNEGMRRNGVKIRFYMDCPEFVDNTIHLNVINKWRDNPQPPTRS